MEAQSLAQELRQRQYNKGLVAKHLIDTISDDDIIASYITCADCGAVQVNVHTLRAVIKIARNTYHFFNLCDHFAETQHRKH